MNPGIHFKRLDIRRLLAAGREPFPAIRQAVETLPEGHGLEIIAPFIPSPLIEMLGSEGFTHSLDHQSDGAWVTRFWKE